MQIGKNPNISRIVWTGNRGEGTSGYRAYDRTWDIAISGKRVVHCLNDPLLGGDPARMNPEDVLLSALSACHMLWYLHLAADAAAALHRRIHEVCFIARSVNFPVGSEPAFDIDD